MAKLASKAPKLECRPSLTLKARILRQLKQNWILYLMMVPVLVYFIVYCYVPMYGVTLAFKKWNAKLGIMGSPWVGLKHFRRFFSGYNLRTSLVIHWESVCITS